MALFKKKIHINSININTPIVGVGMSVEDETDVTECIFEALQGDILTLEGFSALVVPTNKDFIPGHGSLDGYAYPAAGEGLRKELKTLGCCMPGNAEVTGAYNLPYDFIIHVVGKGWDGNSQENVEVLRRCYVSALEKALQYKIRSIAFPSIGTGNNGFPLTKAAGIAVETVERFVREHEGSFDRIVWVLRGKDNYEVYRKIING